MNSRHQSLFTDTIYALSSGRLPSGVAVVRLSGPHVQKVLNHLAGGTPTPTRMKLRRLQDEHGNTLDHALVVFFAGPASFTGEDCAELHLHGGKATVAAVLQRLGKFDGLRMAEPGEFTRRAFINGKIDLTGAEALADLVNAETESQRRLALSNVDGRQRDTYLEWRTQLLRFRALIEAELDFADEADVPGSVSDQVWDATATLSSEIARHIDGFRAAEIVNEGFRVVLVGAPNAGKSSLLNALAGRDVAIVTDIAGTTRDLVEVALDLDGQKIIVTDTAGLRETEDVVEKLGVERTIRAANEADLILKLLGPEDRDINVEHNAPIVRVATKIDLGSNCLSDCNLGISTLTGCGLPELLSEIESRAKAATAAGEGVIPSRARHVRLLTQARAHIASAYQMQGYPLELRAEELRLAAHEIGRIVGAIDVEELLDVIFSEFCIGK